MALGIAVLSTLAASRTGNQLAAGASDAAALTSGYRLAFTIAAGLLAVALVVSFTVLRRPGAAADTAPAGEPLALAL